MKKLAPLAVVAALALVTACGSSDKPEDASYDVSGTVVKQWMDYECSRSAGESGPDLTAMLSMRASGGTGSKSSSSSSSSSSSGGSGRNSAPRTSSAGTSAGAVAGGAAAAASGSGGTSSESSKNKAPAPAKVDRKKIPSGKPLKPKGYNPKFCSEEPELYIREQDGDVFEQDVTRPHYDACETDEQFPACTE